MNLEPKLIKEDRELLEKMLLIKQKELEELDKIDRETHWWRKIESKNLEIAIIFDKLRDLDMEWERKEKN